MFFGCATIFPQKIARFPAMEKVAAYLISLSLIGFGAWITETAIGSQSFAVWCGIAIIPAAIGLLSIYDEL